MRFTKSHAQESEVVHGGKSQILHLLHCSRWKFSLMNCYRWFEVGPPSMKKPPWCGKLQKNQHCWSSKNVHPLERSWPLFFGYGMVSPYSNFVYKKLLSLQLNILIPLSSCKREKHCGLLSRGVNSSKNFLENFTKFQPISLYEIFPIFFRSFSASFL